MIKNRLLRIILTTMLIVAVLFPLLSINFIFPQFVNLLTDHLKNESIQNANHLKYTISNITNLTNLPFSLDTKKSLVRAKDGQTIFSTDSQDLGKHNTQDYFHTQVANGKNVRNPGQKTWYPQIH